MSRFDGLVTCPHRKVDDGGKVLCGLIKGGDREVSLDLCRVCPVPQINCQHLRAAMQKKVSTPITVRFATGRVEVWDDEAPTIGFKQAACAVKAMPIHSARDCAGCPLRLAHVPPQTAAQVARRTKPEAPPIQAPASSRSVAVEAPVAAVSAPVGPPPSGPGIEQAGMGTQAMVARAESLAESNSRRQGRSAADATSPAARVDDVGTAPKIILFQKWLADQLGRKNKSPLNSTQPADQDGVQDIIYAPVISSLEEEAGYERCVGWTD